MFKFLQKKVLLKSIEYFWAPKVLPIPVSILCGKGMGHTSTNTIKVLPILYCPYLIIQYQQPHLPADSHPSKY